MLLRLKTALVDSFVGAIAVGFVMARGLENIGSTFAAPFTVWIEQREDQQITHSSAAPPAFSLQPALPQLLMGTVLLVIAFLLLRWLYYDRPRQESLTQTEDGNPAQ